MEWHEKVRDEMAIGTIVTRSSVEKVPVPPAGGSVPVEEELIFPETPITSFLCLLRVCGKIRCKSDGETE